jgi:hypothetical protein
VSTTSRCLACAAEIAPRSTRVLLTGHAELNAAIAPQPSSTAG